MYRLEVFHSGSARPAHRELVHRASDAMERISALLREHEGCQKVVVFLDETRLFAVDCEGNQIAD